MFPNSLFNDSIQSFNKAEENQPRKYLNMFGAQGFDNEISILTSRDANTELYQSTGKENLVSMHNTHFSSNNSNVFDATNPLPSHNLSPRFTFDAHCRQAKELSSAKFTGQTNLITNSNSCISPAVADNSKNEGSLSSLLLRLPYNYSKDTKNPLSEVNSEILNNEKSFQEPLNISSYTRYEDSFLSDEVQVEPYQNNELNLYNSEKTIFIAPSGLEDLVSNQETNNSCFPLFTTSTRQAELEPGASFKYNLLDPPQITDHLVNAQATETGFNISVQTFEAVEKNNEFQKVSASKIGMGKTFEETKHVKDSDITEISEFKERFLWCQVISDKNVKQIQYTCFNLISPRPQTITSSLINHCDFLQSIGKEECNKFKCTLASSSLMTPCSEKLTSDVKIPNSNRNVENLNLSSETFILHLNTMNNYCHDFNSPVNTNVDEADKDINLNTFQSEIRCKTPRDLIEIPYRNSELKIETKNLPLQFLFSPTLQYVNEPNIRLKIRKDRDEFIKVIDSGKINIEYNLENGSVYSPDNAIKEKMSTNLSSIKKDNFDIDQNNLNDSFSINKNNICNYTKNNGYTVSLSESQQSSILYNYSVSPISPELIPAATLQNTSEQNLKLETQLGINKFFSSLICSLTKEYIDERIELHTIYDQRSPYLFFKQDKTTYCNCLRWKKDAQPLSGSHKIPVVFGQLTGEVMPFTNIHEDDISFKLKFFPQHLSDIKNINTKNKSSFIGLEFNGKLVLSTRKYPGFFSHVHNYKFPESFPHRQDNVNCQFHHISVNGWPHIVVTSIPGVGIKPHDYLIANFGEEFYSQRRNYLMHNIYSELLLYRQLFPLVKRESYTLPTFAPLQSINTFIKTCCICFKRATANKETMHIICDGCFRPYHLTCVGINHRHIQAEQSGWFCYRCETLAEQVYFHSQKKFQVANKPIITNNSTLTSKWMSSVELPCLKAVSPFDETSKVPLFENISNSLLSKKISNIEEGDYFPITGMNRPLFYSLNQFFKPCMSCYRRYRHTDFPASICRLYHLHIAQSYDTRVPLDTYTSTSLILQNMADTLVYTHGEKEKYKNFLNAHGNSKSPASNKINKCIDNTNPLHTPANNQNYGQWIDSHSQKGLSNLLEHNTDEEVVCINNERYINTLTHGNGKVKPGDLSKYAQHSIENDLFINDCDTKCSIVTPKEVDAEKRITRSPDCNHSEIRHVDNQCKSLSSPYIHTLNTFQHTTQNNSTCNSSYSASNSEFPVLTSYDILTARAHELKPWPRGIIWSKENLGWIVQNWCEGKEEIEFVKCTNVDAIKSAFQNAVNIYEEGKKRLILYQYKSLPASKAFKLNKKTFKVIAIHKSTKKQFSALTFGLKHALRQALIWKRLKNKNKKANEQEIKLMKCTEKLSFPAGKSSNKRVSGSDMNHSMHKQFLTHIKEVNASNKTAHLNIKEQPKSSYPFKSSNTSFLFYKFNDSESQHKNHSDTLTNIEEPINDNIDLNNSLTEIKPNKPRRGRPPKKRATICDLHETNIREVVAIPQKIEPTTYDNENNSENIENSNEQKECSELKRCDLYLANNNFLNTININEANGIERDLSINKIIVSTETSPIKKKYDKDSREEFSYKNIRCDKFSNSENTNHLSKKSNDDKNKPQNMIKVMYEKAMSFKPFKAGIYWAKATIRWYVKYKPCPKSNINKYKMFPPHRYDGNIHIAYKAACDFLENNKQYTPFISNSNHSILNLDSNNNFQTSASHSTEINLLDQSKSKIKPDQLDSQTQNTHLGLNTQNHVGNKNTIEEQKHEESKSECFKTPINTSLASTINEKDYTTYETTIERLTKEAESLFPHLFSHDSLQWITKPECGWKVILYEAGMKSTKHFFISRFKNNVSIALRKACWYSSIDFNNIVNNKNSNTSINLTHENQTHDLTPELQSLISQNSENQFNTQNIQLITQDDKSIMRNSQSNKEYIYRKVTVSPETCRLANSCGQNSTETLNPQQSQKVYTNKEHVQGINSSLMNNTANLLNSPSGLDDQDHQEKKKKKIKVHTERRNLERESNTKEVLGSSVFMRHALMFPKRLGIRWIDEEEGGGCGWLVDKNDNLGIHEKLFKVSYFKRPHVAVKEAYLLANEWLQYIHKQLLEMRKCTLSNTTEILEDNRNNYRPTDILSEVTEKVSSDIPREKDALEHSLIIKSTTEKSNDINFSFKNYYSKNKKQFSNSTISSSFTQICGTKTSSEPIHNSPHIEAFYKHDELTSNPSNLDGTNAKHKTPSQSPPHSDLKHNHNKQKDLSTNFKLSHYQITNDLQFEPRKRIKTNISHKSLNEEAKKYTDGKYITYEMQKTCFNVSYKNHKKSIGVVKRGFEEAYRQAIEFLKVCVGSPVLPEEMAHLYSKIQNNDIKSLEDPPHKSPRIYFTNPSSNQENEVSAELNPPSSYASTNASNVQDIIVLQPLESITTSNISMNCSQISLSDIDFPSTNKLEMKQSSPSLCTPDQQIPSGLQENSSIKITPNSAIFQEHYKLYNEEIKEFSLVQKHMSQNSNETVISSSSTPFELENSKPFSNMLNQSDKQSSNDSINATNLEKNSNLHLDYSDEYKKISPRTFESQQDCKENFDLEDKHLTMSPKSSLLPQQSTGSKRVWSSVEVKNQKDIQKNNICSQDLLDSYKGIYEIPFISTKTCNNTSRDKCNSPTSLKTVCSPLYSLNYTNQSKSANTKDFNKHADIHLHSPQNQLLYKKCSPFLPYVTSLDTSLGAPLFENEIASITKNTTDIFLGGKVGNFTPEKVNDIPRCQVTVKNASIGKMKGSLSIPLLPKMNKDLYISATLGCDDDQLDKGSEFKRKVKLKEGNILNSQTRNSINTNIIPIRSEITKDDYQSGFSTDNEETKSYSSVWSPTNDEGCPSLEESSDGFSDKSSSIVSSEDEIYSPGPNNHASRKLSRNNLLQNKLNLSTQSTLQKQNANHFTPGTSPSILDHQAELISSLVRERREQMKKITMIH